MQILIPIIIFLLLGLFCASCIENPCGSNSPDSHTTIWNLDQNAGSEIAIFATNSRDYNRGDFNSGSRDNNALDCSYPPPYETGVSLRYSDHGDGGNTRDFFPGGAFTAGKYLPDGSQLVFGGGFLYDGDGHGGLWVEKWNEETDSGWHRDLIFDMQYDIQFHDAVAREGNGFAVAGEMGSGTPFLLACDDEATIVFNREFPDKTSHNLQLKDDIDRGYFLFLDATADELIYLDNSGATVWEVSQSQSDTLRWKSLAVSFSGAAYIAGNLGNSGSIGIHEFDNTGGVTRTIVTSLNPGSIGEFVVSNDSGFVVSGANAEEVYIYKLNSSGELVWQTTHRFQGETDVRAIKELHDGGFAIAGNTEVGWAFQEAFIIVTNSNGSIQWHRTKRIQ